MITYKDRGWCSQSHVCGNTECYRNYTDEEHKKNTAGVNLPLSWGSFQSDDCGHEEKDK